LLAGISLLESVEASTLHRLLEARGIGLVLFRVEILSGEASDLASDCVIAN
jgi:hypothetical protein